MSSLLRPDAAGNGGPELKNGVYIDAEASKNRTDDLPAAPARDDYAPKKYSAREHALMGAKILLVVGLLFGLLWLVDALKGQ